MSPRAWEIVVYCMMAPIWAYVLFLIVKAVIAVPLAILAVLYVAVLVYAMMRSW